MISLYEIISKSSSNSLDYNLRGKNALITGSSKGIGNYIAKYLKKEGCNVALNGRNLGKFHYENKELNDSLFIEGDVSKPGDANKIIEEFIKEFSSIDILVCNVGNSKSVPPGDEEYYEWQRMMHENLYSATNIISAARKYLSISKGSIICISSICGIETIKKAPATYSVAKAALNTYVKVVSRPFGKEGIRINSIAPGNIIFSGSVWEEKIRSNPNQVKKMLSEDVPLSKLGRPDDIATMVCYLASNVSDFITGSVFKVDGGQLYS